MAKDYTELLVLAQDPNSAITLSDTDGYEWHQVQAIARQARQSGGRFRFKISGPHYQRDELAAIAAEGATVIMPDQSGYEFWDVETIRQAAQAGGGEVHLKVEG
jgi:hypothetical protein